MAKPPVQREGKKAKMAFTKIVQQPVEQEEDFGAKLVENVGVKSLGEESSRKSQDCNLIRSTSQGGGEVSGKYIEFRYT